MLKVIRKHGWAHDPVWSKLTKAEWRRMSATTKAFIKSHYERTCAGCGEKGWTIPGTVPVCWTCWRKVPKDGRAWWWTTARTQRVFLKFLDAYFEGGYHVPEDPRQLAGWREHA